MLLNKASYVKAPRNVQPLTLFYIKKKTADFFIFNAISASPSIFIATFSICISKILVKSIKPEKDWYGQLKYYLRKFQIHVCFNFAVVFGGLFVHFIYTTFYRKGTVRPFSTSNREIISLLYT